MPICHLCYQMRFKDWIDYHQHYEDVHKESMKYSETHERAIRQKAVATPRKGFRTKDDIVKWAETETWLKDYIIDTKPFKRAV